MIMLMTAVMYMILRFMIMMLVIVVVTMMALVEAWRSRALRAAPNGKAAKPIS